MFRWAGYVFDSSVSAAEDDQRPCVLQMNIEWLTASKISVIEQLASHIKALVPVLQETHCSNSDKLVLRSEIPSGICAKLRTVAATNIEVHMP